MRIDEVHQFGYDSHMSGICVIKMDPVIAVTEKIGRKLVEQRLLINVLPVSRFLIKLMEQGKIFVETFSIYMEDGIILTFPGKYVQQI